MPKIFLSYNRDDRVFMHTLRNNLLRLGFDVWIDEGGLVVGTPHWQHTIEDAIRHAGALVVIMTPSAKLSKWVNIELEIAEVNGIDVFPVLALGDKRTAVPPHLLLVQYSDMRGRADYEDGFRQLANSLAVHLNLSIGKFSLDLAGEPLVNMDAKDQTQMPIIEDFIIRELGGRIVEPKSNKSTSMRGLKLPMQSARDSIMASLPRPFDWCLIPTGRVTLEDQDLTFKVQPFLMAKYCITYAQYQVFIDALDGFNNSTWWKGLAQRELEPGDQEWEIADHPREHVSWYDAIAFTRWLTSQTDYTIRLPTEWEWQLAAQGLGGTIYPWGNEYLSGYANINEKASGLKNGNFLDRTRPVGSYPLAASPYGVFDMVGNVWEWCVNEYDRPSSVDTTTDSHRTIRGGSWEVSAYQARTTFRNWGVPHLRDSAYGFRIVADLPELL